MLETFSVVQAIQESKPNGDTMWGHNSTPITLGNDRCFFIYFLPVLIFFLWSLFFGFCDVLKTILPVTFLGIWYFSKLDLAINAHMNCHLFAIFFFLIRNVLGIGTDVHMLVTAVLCLIRLFSSNNVSVQMQFHMSVECRKFFLPLVTLQGLYF